ncbi:MAG: methyltransferase, TIGR04325 family [Xanthobacteraceae bacterium]|jgi:putative methyltransferase (TIGR04325 family)
MSRLRNVVKSLAPPLLVCAARPLWRRLHGIGSHTFEDCYPSFADVPCAPTGHDDDAFAIGHTAALGYLGAGSEKASDLYGRSILPLIVAQSGAPLTVIDYGGGACIGLACILDQRPSPDLTGFSYILVETPAMVAAVRARMNKPFVAVTTDIPQQVEGPLVVHAGSSLQYIDDWRGVLAQLAALKPISIIISLTPFSDLPTYARMQCNIPHKRLASWVFNRAEFAGFMRALGYGCIFEVEHATTFTHKNAPGPACIASMVFTSSN